jgi:superfamily II DNA or RNA helicase
LNQLIEKGYLASWRAKHAIKGRLDLAGVKTTAGDWNQSELSDLMSNEIHLKSAVEAWEKYGENRQSVLIFGVTIDHAEKLAVVFNEAGYRAAAVHSELKKDLRHQILADFEAGNINFLVNVGVLTEGWDSPRVDEIIMCRPTKSPGLFVQMVGRGSRLYKEKKDVLILDLADNFFRHGDPSAPRVRTQFSKEKGDAPVKICPECCSIVHLSQKICPDCGYEFVREIIEVKEAPEMVELNKVFGYLVEDIKLNAYTSMSGNKMVLLRINFIDHEQVKIYLGFDKENHLLVKRKSKNIWRFLTRKRPPQSCKEALERRDEIIIPNYLNPYLDKNLFWKIKEFEL